MGSAPKQGEILKTTIINVYELLKGAEISSRPRENLALVRELILNLTILMLNHGSCEVASKLYTELRCRGHVISEFDILIAAISIYNGETLVSRDKHFKYIENLRLKNVVIILNLREVGWGHCGFTGLFP
ncbi:type II toxin-antitoxin system VapC family toxin [Candidatus Bathyarchaeota archaeon]|nr:type II toxin-antitoxin system VapC family toxin [Candidatus Bathyarchaeota archaeon]